MKRNFMQKRTVWIHKIYEQGECFILKTYLYLKMSVVFFILEIIWKLLEYYEWIILRQEISVNNRGVIINKYIHEVIIFFYHW